MTATRLSPAGTLLRNSRLFALPPALQGPPDDGWASDTATTIYPTRAALETPKTSLLRGDWGLKRHLPTKTTTKTGTPTFRIRGGIDTPDHVADFESAADHVITLRKFQELNIRTVFPPKDNRVRTRLHSVFSPELDNTTDKPLASIGPQATSSPSSRVPQHLRAALEQFEKEEAEDIEIHVQPIDPTRQSNFVQEPAKRWRYNGPYLAGISEVEFDLFLSKITPEKMEEFRAFAKSELITQRTNEKRAELLDQGRTEETSSVLVEVTDADVKQYLKTLRSDTATFASLITRFFDLADGPRAVGLEEWPYGRHTISSEKYQETGPPSTHPSAGLSYQQAAKFTINDVKNGPLLGNRPFPARILQSSIISNDVVQPSVGIAGFVAALQDKFQKRKSMAWAAEKDGRKAVVIPRYTTISEDGRVQIVSTVADNYVLDDDEPVTKAESGQYQEPIPAAARNTSTRMPQQDRFRKVRVDQSIVDHQTQGQSPWTI